MILEILSFHKGSAEEQVQFADELERLDDRQQLALRVYLEYDDSLLNCCDPQEAVNLADEAYQGQYDSEADFAAEFMEDIDPDFAEKVSQLMGWQAWQQMWDYSLRWDYEFVEVAGVGFIIRKM